MTSRISNIVPFLIITLVCILGVEGGYLALERFVIDPVIATKPKQETEAKQQVQQPRPNSRTVTRIDYGVITRRNLFGPPPDNGGPVVVETPPEELEATSLEVVLMGTVGGGDESRAIILDKRDRKQEIYSVGDDVQGALIKEILRGKVILNLDGKDEMLDMSEAAQYGPKTPARPVSVNPAIRTRRVIETPTVNGGEQTSEVRPRTRVVRPTRRIIRPQPTEEIAAEPGEELEEPVEPLEADEPGDEAVEELVEEEPVEEGAVEENGEAEIPLE